MRRIVALILFLCVSAPALTTAAINQPTAANPRPPLSTKCPKGVSSEAPKLSSKFLQQASDPAAQTKAQAEAELFLNSAIYCPNACFDLVATLTLKGPPPPWAAIGVQVDVQATNHCSSSTLAPNHPDQKPNKRGCAYEEQRPTITLITKEVYSVVKGFKILDQNFTVKRCDDEILKTAVAKFFDGLQKTGKGETVKEGEAQMASALKELQEYKSLAPTERPFEVPVPKAPEPPPPPAPTEAQQKLIDALEERGVSKADAQRMVMSDAKTIAAMFEKLEENDVTAARTLGMKAGINEDILNNFSSISMEVPPDLPKPEDVALNPPKTTEISTVPAAAAPPPPPPPELPGGRLGPMYKQIEDDSGLTERGLSGYLARNSKTENPGGNPKTCAPAHMSSACGDNQYTLGTWDADSRLINGGVPLHPDLRKDPETSARVTAAAAVRDYDKHKDLIERAGLSKEHGVYAVHNLGIGGGPRFMNGRIQYGVNAPVSTSLTYTEMRNNPSLYLNRDGSAVTYAEAERRIEASMTRGQRAAGAPAIAASSPYRVAGGALSPWTGYYAPMPYGYSQSPYGYANPFYYYGQTGQSYPTSYGGYGTGGTGGSSPYSWITSLFSNLMGTGKSSQSNTQPKTSNTPTTPSIPTSVTPGTPAQGVATIIAQPQKVFVGNSVVVSWSTVGTKANSPCTATQWNGKATTTLAIANEGSKTVKTTAAGTLTFTITCTSDTNTLLQKSTNVTVQ